MPRENNPQPNAPVVREGGNVSPSWSGYFNQLDFVEGDRLMGRWAGLDAGPWQWITLGTGVELSADGVLSADGLGGDVVGPAASTDGFVALWDGATGKLLQDSTINGAWFDQGVLTTSTPQFARLGVGTAASVDALALVAGTLNPVNVGFGIVTNPTINAAVNQNATLLGVLGTIAEAASGTHALLAGVTISPPTITAGAAAVTNTASLFITNAPNAAGATNYALWIGLGTSRFDGAVDVDSLVVNGSTVTVNGNTTLNDWFDQSVKTSASPTFAGLTVNTHAITVNGAPTLNDWFNQSVKTTASPTFDALTVTNALGADEINATSDVESPLFISQGENGVDAGPFDLALDGGGAVTIRVKGGIIVELA